MYLPYECIYKNPRHRQRLDKGKDVLLEHKDRQAPTAVSCRPVLGYCPDWGEMASKHCRTGTNTQSQLATSEPPSMSNASIAFDEKTVAQDAQDRVACQVRSDVGGRQA